MLEDGLLLLGDFKSATAHHPLGYIEKLLQTHVAEARGGRSFAETRHEYARKTAPVDIHAHTEHGGRVEHAVHSGFRMVAHDQAAKLQVGAHEALLYIIPDPDFAVVVFQIRGVDTGSDVTPLPYHGVAQIAVVALVAVAYHHYIAQFAAGLAIRPKRGAPVDLGSHPHLGIVAYGQPATDACAFHHLCILSYIYGTLAQVDDGSLDHSTLLYEKLRKAVCVGKGSYNEIVGISFGRIPPLREPAEVFFQSESIVEEDIKHISQPAAFPFILHVFHILASLVATHSAEGDGRSARIHQALAALQGAHGIGYLRRGNHGRIHMQGLVALLDLAREDIAHKVGCLHAVLSRKQRFPLLPQRSDPYPYLRDGARKGYGKQILKVFLRVVYDDMLHFLHKFSRFAQK